MKAIAIGIVEVNPLGELTDCSFPRHSTSVLTLNSGILFKRAIPLYPLLYSSLSSIFLNYRDTFNNVTFLFKIDHDDGTVSTDNTT